MKNWNTRPLLDIKITRYKKSELTGRPFTIVKLVSYEQDSLDVDKSLSFEVSSNVSEEILGELISILEIYSEENTTQGSSGEETAG